MKCKYITWSAVNNIYMILNHENNKYEFNKSDDLSHTDEDAILELNLHLSYLGSQHAIYEPRKLRIAMQISDLRVNARSSI